MLARRIQQHLRAQNIGTNKSLGAQVQASIHMTFSRKIDHSVKAIFAKNSSNLRPVRNIALDEPVTGITLNSGQVFKIAGIRQGIKVHNKCGRVGLKQVMDKI